jgi:hypothetical protein
MRYHDGVRPTSRGKSLVEYDPEIEMNWHTGLNFRKKIWDHSKESQKKLLSVLK